MTLTEIEIRARQAGKSQMHAFMTKRLEEAGYTRCTFHKIPFAVGWHKPGTTCDTAHVSTEARCAATPPDLGVPQGVRP